MLRIKLVKKREIKINLIFMDSWLFLIIFKTKKRRETYFLIINPFILNREFLKCYCNCHVFGGVVSVRLTITKNMCLVAKESIAQHNDRFRPVPNLMHLH